VKNVLSIVWPMVWPTVWLMALLTIGCSAHRETTTQKTTEPPRIYASLEKLPFRVNLTELPAGKVGADKNLKITVNVKLPGNQKLNKNAPSSIRIYEKKGAVWNEIKRVDLRTYPFTNQTLGITDTFSTIQSNSELTVDTIIYHCPKNNIGVCSIESFRSKINRTKTLLPKKLTLDIEVKGI